MKLGLVAIVLAITACARAGGPEQHQSDAPPPMIDAKVDAAIDANLCAVQPCDIATQCGCPADKACDLSSLGGNACRVSDPAGVEGTVCASAGKCARGYTCVGGGGNYSCERYCQSNSDCLAPRGQCVIQLVDSGGAAIAGAVMCSSNCDPSTATNPLCPGGWTCDLFTATYMSTTHSIVDCRVAGAGALGADCTSTACGAGLTCVTQGTAKNCRKMCNRTANTGCTTGTCTSFGTPFTVGGTEYGVCL